MIEYKGYTGTFEYDPELELLAGHVIDLRDEIYFEGESVTELRSVGFDRAQSCWSLG